MSDKIGVALSSTALEVNAGESVELTATINNRSQVVDQFTIVLEGLDPAWYDLSVASVSLFPGDKDQIKVTIHPPKTAETKAGSYPFTVRAVSGADPQQSTAAEASVEVRTFAGLSVDMSPTRIVGQSGTYVITLNNQGNADATQSFEASDPEEGLNYTFKPEEVTVPAGGSATVELVAKLKKKPKVDGEKEYPFQVVVKPSGADKFSPEAKTLNGQLVYERKARPKPKIPRWLIGVLAAVAVIIIVIILLKGCAGPPEIIEFDYEPAEEGCMLCWLVEGASEGDVNGEAIAEESLGNGTMLVSPTTLTEYVLTVRNQEGEDTAAITIQPPPRIEFFKAEWVTESFLLSWRVVEASKVYLNDEVVGFEGEKKVDPDEMTTYVLRAENEVNVVEKSLTVAPPIVTVISPNGGEELVIGSRHSITWIAATPEIDGSPADPGIHHVGLEYSSDGGGTWDTIDGDEENDGSYSWMVPDDPSDSCLVRITTYYDESGVLAQDTSDEFFSIVARATVEVTSPAAGDYWWAGNSYNIEWTTTGLGIDHVGLEYSTDGGTSWDSIAGSTDDDSRYSWNVPPGINSERCRVRATIYDSTNGMLDSDMSDDFTIAEATVEITSPTGGEHWWVGETKNIEWTTTGLGIDHVGLEYSTNGGTSWTSIAGSTANDGIYNWEIPPGIASDRCMVQVTIYGESGTLNSGRSGTFTISTASVTVESPARGEVWWTGDLRSIQWTTTGLGIDHVRLKVAWIDFRGKHSSIIADEQPDNGSYSWEVPPGINSDQCSVQVIIYAEGGTLDSDISGIFTISEVPTVQLTTDLMEGDVWMVGQRREITWTTTGLGIDHVAIGLCTNYVPGGKNYFVTIARDEPDDGSYTWTVTEPTSNQCVMKVSIYGPEDRTPLDSDESDVFKIRPYLP